MSTTPSANPDPCEYEHLGQFYLGKVYDPAQRRRLDDLLLYDSKDLVTHALCVGMTGSGKTGLCIGLLEEAAIDGVPAIVIDPKGDLANLLLAFPDLAPADFRPWINEEDAARKGMDPDAFAARQAETWSKGLAEWGQHGERVRRLRDAAQFTVFTPGSSAGEQVSVLRSFDAPPGAIRDDAELFTEYVLGTATSLLGLLEIPCDSKAREHILISNILSDAWSKGESLDIATLIERIQRPRQNRVGVMELESFFPATDRFTLAMQVNNLLASPGFVRWTQGRPLDIASMLFTSKGKPCVSIFSIAHLSDAERMFFVSMLLNQVLSWTRTQSGTSSLRAIVYMDEIAGYVPPVANPPSKRPLLTLLKQGRAYGVGVVLATQNPGDLDYKGLSNCGTWFIGRLQTDRDKQRVLDGLEGAAADKQGFDRASMDALLSGLTQRVFLLNNINDSHPVIFETRWCMSYLRGPLTREQIRALTRVTQVTQSESTAQAPPQHCASSDSTPARSPAAISAPEPGPLSAKSSTNQSMPAAASVIRTSTQLLRAVSAAHVRPSLPPEIPEFFLPIAIPGEVMYRAAMLGIASILYTDTKLKIHAERGASMLAEFEEGPVILDWPRGHAVKLTDRDVHHEPVPNARFGELPAEAGRPKAYEYWRKSLQESLFRSQTLELLRSESAMLTALPDEPERAFRMRLHDAARAARDSDTEKLRAKYAPKLATLNERFRRAVQAIEVQKEQASVAKVSGVLGLGSAVLGAFLGRKVSSATNVARATSAARGLSRSGKESSDVTRAIENADAVREQIEALEAEFRAEVAGLSARVDSSQEELQKVVLRPKKTNITVRAVLLVWVPHHAITGEPLWNSRAATVR